MIIKVGVERRTHHIHDQIIIGSFSSHLIDMRYAIIYELIFSLYFFDDFDLIIEARFIGGALFYFDCD